MSLPTHQVEIVQQTFDMVVDADDLATRFYDRLFEVDPSLRGMFRGDMTEQRKKLMQTIAVVVNALNSLDTIVPAIEALGRRHVGYGVQVHHWDTVGAALLWALEDSFGPVFTSEIREAWAAAYSLIAQTAIAAAYTKDTVQEGEKIG